jgi:pimeloyl-ACP methyl ester carboxylesterase
VLSWERPAELPVPIHQIHGARDRVLPASPTRADVIVPGAGHVLSLTHAEDVNRFLRERMA